MKAEFTQQEWPTPTRLEKCPVDHQLLFFPPPVSFRGKGRFKDFGSDCLQRLAPAMWHPAGMTLEAHGTGGPTRGLRYGFSQARLAELMQADLQWRPEDLMRGLDLEGSRVMPLMVRMVDELLHPGMASDVLIETLATGMIVELVRYLRLGEAEESIPGQLSAAQMTLIRDRVEASDCPTPSVAELARLCRLGERHLLRLFKATTGWKVSEFIRQAQLKRAQEMLSDTQLPLKEVAYRLGFCGHSSFSAAFRKISGETPKQFRHRVRDRTVISMRTGH